MRVGFIGDIVGRPGREMIAKYAKNTKDEFRIDFLIANCENASGGFGLSAKNAIELLKCEIDVITGGNHSFDKKDVINLMSNLPIIRPFNLYEAPGDGVINLEKNGENLSVVNLLGIMGLNLAKNSFFAIDDAIKKCKSKNIVVDFHAEMTSEKMAFLWANKGKVSAILGTHTHVGTDDLKITNNTLFVSDVGLTGSREGVIGMDGDISVTGFKTGIKQAFKVNHEYKKIFQIIIFDIIDSKTTSAFKLKIIDDKKIITEAYYD